MSTDPAARRQRQTAWHIRVASSLAALNAGHGDLWDSGRRAAGDDVGVAYGGAALATRQPCAWSVRVWDEVGNPSDWSAPARWRMGLLDPGDWQAAWIGLDEPEPSAMLPAEWIWADAPRQGGQLCLLRRSFVCAEQPASALAWMTADASAVLRLNGETIGEAAGFTFAPGFDLLPGIRRGENVLAIRAVGWGGNSAVAVRLALRFADGSTRDLISDGAWQAQIGPQEGWERPGFGASWPPAAVFGKVGAPVGSGVPLGRGADRPGAAGALAPAGLFGRA